MRTPSVSVVIPARNAARFLDATLATIAYQTRPVDQVVIVDDASTDDTRECALRWSSRLPLTVETLSRNSGPGVARQTGVELSASELVLFLDADDIWLPEHVEVMLNHWGGRDTIVSPLALTWHAGEGVRLPARLMQPPMPDRDQLGVLLRENRVFAGSLVSRELLLSSGGFPSRWPSEDYELWVRLVTGGAQVVNPAAATVLYRRHAASLSTSPKVFEREIEILSEWSAAHPERHSRSVARSIRLSRSRLALLEAYSSAGAGDLSASRSHALRALWFGNTGIRLRSAAMLLSPRRFCGFRRSHNGGVPRPSPFRSWSPEDP